MATNANVTVRSELKKILSHIETLAHEAHTRLTAGNPILDVANELVKNSVTLTFSLGSLYATEKQAASQTVNVVKRKPQSNWHNVRDSRGRFASKVVRP